MLVSVCMCTYKRIHLYKTLKSINDLVLPVNITLEVIVVDNDEECSAEKIVADSKKGFKYPIKYISQPYKNISVARNEYLKAANGEYIASIDDDEVADKFWLNNLLQAAEKFDASIVFGKIESIYPNGSPKWIKEGAFFDREIKVTGSHVTSGGTGCTLTHRQALISTGYSFDAEYGRTGGEDADLFYRLYNKGFKLITCREAIVSELVEDNRLNSEYLVNRAIRVGQTYSRYRYGKKVKDIIKIKFVMKTIMKILVCFLFTLLSLPLGKKYFYKHFLKALTNYGKLSYFLNTNEIKLY